MKKPLFFKYILMTLVCLFSLSVTAAANKQIMNPKALGNSTIPTIPTSANMTAPTSQTEVKSTAVASATPNGKSFSLNFQKIEFENAYRQYAGDQMSKGTSVSQDQFRDMVQKEATDKLRAMFPDGVPPPTASKIKITITISFKPTVITIKVEF